MDKLEIARKALKELSDYIDCGCVPCRGECWSKEALREEISDRCAVAQAALKAIDGDTPLAIRCDEPTDLFTRITRDMARSA
jgi:hypothetical protein